MSRENVELVLKAEVAFNRGDLESFVSLAHPDIEWDAGLLGTPTYRGRGGIQKMLRDVQAAWADMRMEIIDTPVEIDDAVVFEVRLNAHGRSTGAPVEASQFFVAEFNGGLCIRSRAFDTKSEALEAVGLTE